METTEYRTMSELEETYWWHVGRKHIIRKQLNVLGFKKADTKILNIGSGTGATVPLLEKYGEVTNVDVSAEAIAESKRKGVKNLHKVDGIELPFKDNTFDLAVAFDVLEHIDDDYRALREWWRVLKPGGKLMITSPAHSWLWSVHDESLHHYRRYSLSGVHRLFNLAGFETVKRSYAIMFSFPMIVFYRFMNSLRSNQKKTSYVKLPRPINWFFASILRVEASLLKRMNMPFGTSVLVIGAKDPNYKGYGKIE